MFSRGITKCSRLAAPAARSLHSSAVAQKTATEKVKEVAQDVNLKLGQGLASAIDKGEKAAETVSSSASSAAETTKQKVGSTTEETKKQAAETTQETKQKANQAASGARQAKDSFANEMRK